MIGTTTAILTTQQELNASLDVKMQSLNAYMYERQLPHSLAVRVRKHFRYYWSRALIASEDEAKLLNSLSNGLREEIVGFLFKNTIETNPLFKKWEVQGKHDELKPDAAFDVSSDKTSYAIFGTPAYTKFQVSLGHRVYVARA